MTGIVTGGTLDLKFIYSFNQGLGKPPAWSKAPRKTLKANLLTGGLKTTQTVDTFMVQTAAQGPNIATVTGVTGCDRKSTVLASICEYDPAGGPFMAPGGNNVWIYNIAAQDGGTVKINFFVNDSNDRNVQLNIQVC
jgi:hypothetical protein